MDPQHEQELPATGCGRVAVIAVHGVADQALGDTAEAIAELLIAQTPNGSGYAPGIRSELVLQVAPVPPLAQYSPLDKSENTLLKHLRQSTESDFLKEHWSAKGARRSIQGAGAGFTPGAQYTDYLLMKAKRNEMPVDTFAAPRISLNRKKAGSPDCAVDVYEMYWADLSRLSGSVPRILTELFTLLFRLSSLGRETVQSAAARFSESGPWKWLRWLQAALDWLYSRVLALLFLQLVMLALMLTPLGIGAPHTSLVHKVVSVLAGSALALWVEYRFRTTTVAVLTGIVSGAVLWKLHPGWVVGIFWAGILAVFYDWWMRVCDERFKMVRATGWVLWLITLATIVLVAARHPTNDLGMWVEGSLRGVEVVLFLIVIWWVIGGALLAAWFGAGFFAARIASGANDENSIKARFQARASVATGRMGLIVSMGFFLVLSMSGWALVSKGVELAVEKFHYAPFIFTDVTLPCATGAAAGTAQRFLQDRFCNSTDAFSVIALLLLGLVVYLTIVCAPSALAELKVITEQFRRLGLWLTGGYRQFDRVIAAIATPAVLLAFLMGLLLLLLRFDVDLLPDLNKQIAEWSRQILSNLVISAGAATLALSAAGRILSRYVPWLRAPLDAAIDVDNHLREFPRKAIPRARIFSRYVAVLDHIVNQEPPYERIVVVSHSQGTVISTELFRYMKERAGIGGDSDEIRTLWRKMKKGSLILLTAGCPLRQLYAARFPVMYDWVLGTGPLGMGPVAADVGVTRWLNVYATGDYVGRWLWSRQSGSSDVSATMVDERLQAGNDTYTPYSTTPNTLATLMGTATERDISLGAGAHTHYFDKDQKVVASIIDAMIASPSVSH